MRHNTRLLLQGLSFFVDKTIMANNDLYTSQLMVFLYTDGIKKKNGELPFQQDSALLHFSHEVWNALHVKWDWTNVVVPTKSTSLTTVLIKNLIYAKKSNIYVICGGELRQVWQQSHQKPFNQHGKK